MVGCLGFVAASRQDVSAAQELYPNLLSQPGQWSWLCSTDRLRGLLVQILGDLDKATTHFEDALNFNQQAGYGPELAWTSYEYGKLLVQRSNPRDQVRAANLLDEALRISTELGMPTLMDRVASLREQTGLQSTKTPTYPDGLTEREVEILRLVAAGKSNPEIAEELFISPRTVSTHVSNILNKIGAANRTEAATYASRQGLL